MRGSGTTTSAPRAICRTLGVGVTLAGVVALAGCGSGGTAATNGRSSAASATTTAAAPSSSAAVTTAAAASPRATPTTSSELCGVLTPDAAAQVVADIRPDSVAGLPNSCGYSNTQTDSVSLSYYSLADLAKLLNQPDLTIEGYFQQLIDKGNSGGVTTTAYDLGDRAVESRTTRDTGRSVPGGFHSVTVTWAHGDGIYSVDGSTNVNESGANPGGSTIIPATVEALARQVSEQL